jgi:hypothetical protein
MYYHAIGGVIIALILISGHYLITQQSFRVYSMRQYGLLLMCCALDCAGMFTHIIAFQCDSSGFVALVGYMAVPYAQLVDLFVFG